MNNLEAAKYVDNQRYNAIYLHKDFTFETVLSSNYKLELLERAKQEGYFIKCVFVLTNDPGINVERVRTRVAGGGHAVPTDKIIERYYKSLGNIKGLVELCDILHVYDNTKEPCRIIRKHKEELTIFTNDFWDKTSVMNLLTGNIQNLIKQMNYF